MELLNKLQSGGLTKREAHIYLALLQKKEFAVSELASMIPIGRTKVYELLPGLISKGLCTEIQRDGKKVFCAVEPKSALKNLLNYHRKQIQEEIEKKEEELEEKKQLFGNMEDELGEIYLNNADKTGKLDYIELLKDRNQIRQRWVDLQKNIKKELLGFNKPPYSMRKGENIKHQKELMKRNKKLNNRGIYEYGDILSDSTPTDFFTIVDHYSKLGEDCRVIERLPMKLMIIDEKITMLALNDPVSMKPTITTMIINHPSFATAQKEVFNSYWNKAIPFKEFKKSIKK